MSQELVTHTSVQAHTPPFSLAGATAYTVDVSGTLADGGVELMMLQNGGYMPLNPPIRFLQSESGGTKMIGLLPSGAKFSWRVASGVIRATTFNSKITSAHN